MMSLPNTDQKQNTKLDAVSGPQPPRLTTTCPHCGEALDLGSWSYSHPPPPPNQPAPAQSSVTTQISRLWQWMCPITTGATKTMPLPIKQRLRRLGLILLPVLIGLLWMLFGGGLRLPSASTTPTVAISATPVSSVVETTVDPTDQAVLAVVTAYNAADPVVAATQSLDPIEPYLDPDGALYKERKDALTARQAAGDSYMVRMVAMGSSPQVDIDPSGTTATVITQETWEGTVVGEPLQTATVRVAYTLERMDDDSGWWIVAAERLTL